MRITILTTFVTAGGVFNAGTTVDVGNEDARRYIVGGLAAPAEPERMQSPERQRVKLRKATKEGTNASD